MNDMSSLEHLDYRVLVQFPTPIPEVNLIDHPLADREHHPTIVFVIERTVLWGTGSGFQKSRADSMMGVQVVLDELKLPFFLTKKVVGAER